MSTLTLPLDQIPRWAVVAFAARSLRRVQPLFASGWRRANEEHTDAINNAIALAEIAAAHAISDGAAINTGNAAREAGTAAKSAVGRAPTAWRGRASASVAHAAYHCAMSAAVDSSADAVRWVTGALQYINQALSEYSDITTKVVVFEMAQDFEHLKETAMKEGWTDESLVPRDFFGPLWPNEEPMDWPEIDVPILPNDSFITDDFKKTVEQLPRRLAVAFAAKCARRVQPLVQFQWPKVSRKELEAIDQAINVAQTHATGSPRPKDLDAARLVKPHADKAEADKKKGAALAARAAMWAATSSTRYDVADAVLGSAAAAYAAASDAGSAVGGSAIREWPKAVRHEMHNDLEILNSIDVTDSPNDIVSPESLFLPLWTKGEPTDWLITRVPHDDADAELTHSMKDELDRPPQALIKDVNNFRQLVQEHAKSAGQQREDTIRQYEELKEKIADAVRVTETDSESIKTPASKIASDANDVMKRISEVDQRINEGMNKVEDDLDKAMEDTETKLKGIQEAAGIQFATEAPVEYWTRRRKQHRTGFRFWGSVLVFGSVLTMTGAYFLWGHLFSLPDDQPVNALNANQPLGMAFHASRFGFAVLTGTVLLLMMRVLTRITISHLHLSNEADERVTMMQAYLALTAAGKMDESQRAFVLQALFRASTTGLVKEDAVPASVMDLASRILHPPPDRHSAT